MIKQCKRCKGIKIFWNFYKEVIYAWADKFTFRIEICKDCVEEVKEEAFQQYCKENHLSHFF